MTLGASAFIRLRANPADDRRKFRIILLQEQNTEFITEIL